MPAIAGPAELSATSQRVFDALKKQCSLAWSIMKTQCALAGLDPNRLAPDDLECIVEKACVALARFTTEEKARKFRHELLGVRQVAPPPMSGGAPPARRSSTPAPLPAAVVKVLESVSPLAWPLLQAQCERAGIDPGNLRASELIDLLPQLRRALARFASEPRADAAIAELRRLVDQAAPGDPFSRSA